MSWAGKAAEAAWQVLGYGRGFSEGERRSGFNTGARWQRDQLRTDEAVERVAESLWLTDAPCADNGAVWAEQDYYMKLDYCRSAEAAINALLGEDT